MVSLLLRRTDDFLRMVSCGNAIHPFLGTLLLCFILILNCYYDWHDHNKLLVICDNSPSFLVHGVSFVGINKWIVYSNNNNNNNSKSGNTNINNNSNSGNNNPKKAAIIATAETITATTTVVNYFWEVYRWSCLSIETKGKDEFLHIRKLSMTLESE